jgi:hypothetical protein
VCDQPEWRDIYRGNSQHTVDQGYNVEHQMKWKDPKIKALAESKVNIAG